MNVSVAPPGHLDCWLSRSSDLPARELEVFRQSLEHLSDEEASATLLAATARSGVA
jgi:hypothetical protein